MDSIDALLEQVRTLARSVWRRRWMVMAVSAATAFVLAIGVSFVPNRYQATARVYVDTQTVLKPLMSGLAYQPDIEQQVRMLARTLVSRPNVERILETHDFGWNLSEPVAHEKLINKLMKRITIEGSSSTNLYLMTFRDTEPERARRVVASMVDLFVHSGLGDKKRDSEDASRFINDQIKDYEGKLVEAENRVKEFKIRNLDITSGQSQDYFARMAALSDAVSRLRTDLAAAEQSRDAYRRALSSEEPQLPVELAANVAVAPPSDLDVRLSTQKKSLDDLLRRYTEQHPDVISARRTIAQLEAQKRRELDTRVHSPDRRSAATSPVYQQLRVALAEAEAQVASLRAKLNAQQTQLNQTRAVASRVPQVESDLAQLNRDYDIIRKNYDMLVARRESASLGVKMDESSQLADFRVVEPPRVDPKPVFPSRIALGVLAVLVSLVSGIAVVIGLDRLRPTFHEIRSLQEATRRPVLGTVSVSGGALANAGGQALRFVGAVAGLLVLQILWLAWLATHASLL